MKGLHSKLNLILEPLQSTPRGNIAIKISSCVDAI
ncbi:unnamed protein product [Gulo gulo]|uniref:Uncharacterized protein n=1 Tax=Gulo gulo TaxID=48420 RepID=A0A9X9MEB1_GULGU|nr:unnamed protein product [Gulo gulo]